MAVKLTLIVIEFRFPIAVVLVPAVDRRRRVGLQAAEVLTPPGPTCVLFQSLLLGPPVDK